MSVVFEQGNCRFIKHDQQVGVFELENGEKCRYKLRDILFENFKRKGKNKSDQKLDEIEEFLKACNDTNIFSSNVSDATVEMLKAANMELTKKLYDCSSDLSSFHGENNLDHGKVTKLGDCTFLIPPHCKFRQGDVGDIEAYLTQTKFDFIVIDPPWGNRFVKRARKKSDLKRGYHTMTDDEIESLPIGNYIKETSLVVVWCTNSETHIKSLREKFLAKWNLKLLATWKWFKVDKRGEFFCSHFPIDGNKKPFELIFVATHQDNSGYSKKLVENLMIFSHPSSIHSHKPPLLELFLEYLPAQPQCLEIFARSLNENFTSIGLEVMKLQNEMLFEKINN